MSPSIQECHCKFKDILQKRRIHIFVFYYIRLFGKDTSIK